MKMNETAYYTSNANYDFYIQKTRCAWYTIACKKGTTPEEHKDTLAGFSTMKAAKHCAEVWATWF